MPKVGDTVKITKAGSRFTEPLLNKSFTVTRIESEVDGFYINSEGIHDETEPNIFANLGDKWEIVTTVQEVEDNETALILRTIDEAIFYDGYKPAPSLAKANEVIAALVQILVAKDLITAGDVSRILKQVPAFTNVQSSKED